MRVWLVVAIVVVPFNGRILKGADYAFDLAVGPWIIGLRQLVLNVICLVDHIKSHGPGIDGVPFAVLLTELDPVVR